MLKQIIVASLAIVSLAATSAQAQDARTVKVSIAGIDMHSESGVRIVLQRIKFAAHTVCGQAPSHLERFRQYEPCVQEVTNETVASLNNPILTAMLNQGDTGAHPAVLASAK